MLGLTLLCVLGYLMITREVGAVETRLLIQLGLTLGLGFVLQALSQHDLNIVGGVYIFVGVVIYWASWLNLISVARTFPKKKRRAS